VEPVVGRGAVLLFGGLFLSTGKARREKWNLPEGISKGAVRFPCRGGDHQGKKTDGSTGDAVGSWSLWVRDLSDQTRGGWLLESQEKRGELWTSCLIWRRNRESQWALGGEGKTVPCTLCKRPGGKSCGLMGDSLKGCT